MLGQAAPRLSARWQPRGLRIADALLRQLAVALLTAAVLEVTLLRLTTRVGVHLPRSEPVSAGLRAASFFGSLAFNSASILAIGLAALVVLALASRLRDAPPRALLVLAGGALLLSLAMSLTVGGAAWDGAFGLASTTLAVVLGGGAVVRSGTRPSVRAAVVLIVAAYVCYQYYSLSHTAYRLLDYTTLPPLGVEVLWGGEALVVVAAFAAFWAWGRSHWRIAGPLGIAAVIGIVALLAASTLAPSSTTSILALWTTGMSFSLPAPLYLLALLLYLVTVIACLREDRTFWAGTGLALILVAGYMPEATYQHVLVVLGIGFLAGWQDSAERGVREPAR